MKRVTLALLLLALAAWPAHAQSPVSVIGPVNPGNCVVFNTTTIVKDVGFPCGSSGGSVVGPGTSVVGDIALWNNITGTLLSDGGGGAPSLPQPHPASGNILCPSGFNGTVASPNHVLTWADQTQCWTNDVQLWTSFDPSALLSVTLSGTPNASDIEVLTFHFNATTYSAQYTVQGGDTLTKIASCLVSNLNSGCAGSGNFGIIQGGTTSAVALYNNVAGSQGQVFYAVSVGAVVDLDFNSAVSMYMSFTSTGGRLTVAYGGTNGAQSCTVGTPCITGLDNNPVQQTERCAASGTSPPCVVPAPGSIVWAHTAIGASSTGNADTTYGTQTVSIQNSAAGSILGRWGITVANHGGADGLYIGNGVCTVSYSCQGRDSFNTGFFQSANGVTGGYFLSNSVGVADGSLQEGSGGSVFFNMGAINIFTVRDHTSNPLVEVTGVGTAGVGLTYTGASTFAASSLVSAVPVTFPDGGIWGSSGITGTTIASSTIAASNTIVGIGMKKLCTITASNSAVMSYASPSSGTCTIDNTYTSYQLVFQNVLPATNERVIEFQVHSGGAFQTSGYNGSNIISANSSVGSSASNSTAYLPLTHVTAGANQSMGNIAPGYSGTITLTNPSANQIMNITGQFGYWGGGGAGWQVTGQIFGAWSTAGVVDGFRVQMDSGNIVSGSIIVYGIP